MRVEFVGLPGAGKSTIAAALVNQMQGAGYQCLNSPTFATLGRAERTGQIGRVERACADLILAARPTWKCRHLLLQLLRTKIDRRRLRSRFWLLVRIWLAIERLQTRPGGVSAPCVSVFDQGILQCLPSIYPSQLSPREESDLTRSAILALGNLVPPTVVIVVIDAETAARRLSSRPFQRTLFDITQNDLATQLDSQRRFFYHTLPSQLEETGVQVYQVSGTEPAISNAVRICNQLVMRQDSTHQSEIGHDGLTPPVRHCAPPESR
jgi:hypothetical protein